jgi:hypothetical protein
MTVRNGRPEDNPFRRPMVIVGAKRPTPAANKAAARPPDDLPKPP